MDFLPSVNECLAFFNALCNDTHVCICLDFTPFIFVVVLILHPSIFSLIETPFAPFYIIFSLIETPFATFYIFTHIETPLGSIWLEKWKSGRIENWEGIEKWEDRRNLVFSYFCLVERVEKWREGKLIYLVKKKNERIEKWSWYKFIIMSLLNKTKKQHIFLAKILFMCKQKCHTIF